MIRSPGHERFAFDLAAVDAASGRTLRKSRLHHLLGRATVDDSHSWSRTIHAPVNGILDIAVDDVGDRERLALLRDALKVVVRGLLADSGDIRFFAGNHVVIRGDACLVFLAHMRAGSVAPARGDAVGVGQPIGKVGNSGLTLEPHLHLQLLDPAEGLHSAKAVPFVVREYERWTGEGWERSSHAVLEKGSLIRSVPRVDGPGDPVGS